MRKLCLRLLRQARDEAEAKILDSKTCFERMLRNDENKILIDM